MISEPHVVCFDESVERTLEALSRTLPGPVRRARPWIRRLLGNAASPHGDSGNESRSVLTYHGFPLEFCFVSGDPSVRYTTDVDPTDTPPDSRLERASSLLGEAGHPLPPSLLTRCLALQRGQPLRFGAWIGGRHGPDTDRFKIYVEVADPDQRSLERWLRRLLRRDTSLPDRCHELRLIGYEPETKRLELYFRGFMLQPHHLYHLLRRVDLDARQPDLMACLRGIFPNQDRGRWSIYKLGFSYTFREEEPEGFSLFVPATKLFGSDPSVRRGLLERKSGPDWTPTGYRRASAALAGSERTYHYHGMLSCSTAFEGPVQMSIGLQPPPEHT